MDHLVFDFLGTRLSTTRSGELSMAAYISQVHLADDGLYRLFGTKIATVLSGTRLNIVHNRLRDKVAQFKARDDYRRWRGSLDPVSAISSLAEQTRRFH